jgi:hypothetical protein
MDNETFTNEKPGIGTTTEKLRDDVGRIGQTLAEGRDSLLKPVLDLVNNKPFVAVGIAFGVGYILAGGLFSRVTLKLLSAGMRLGGMAVVNEVLGNFNPGISTTTERRF